MIEYAQWTAIAVSIAELVISVTDKRIYRHFKSNGAVSSQTAMAIKSPNSIFTWRLQRLLKSGFVRIDPSNNYYFDETAYMEKRKNRRLRAIIALTLISIFILSLYWSQMT